MKKNMLLRERVRFYILGILSIIGLLVLSGSTNHSQPPPNYGRYQISSWGAYFGNSKGGYGAFIIDTITGETKTVYSHFTSPDNEPVITNNLNKTFYSIK